MTSDGRTSRSFFWFGLIMSVAGVVVFFSKPKKPGASQDNLRFAACIVLAIGGIALFVSLVAFIYETIVESDNQTTSRSSTRTRLSQIDPSIHVITINEPEGYNSRFVNYTGDSPPSYEEAIKNSAHSSTPVLNVSTPISYSARRNMSSHNLSPNRPSLQARSPNHLTVPTRSPSNPNHWNAPPPY